MQRMSVETWQPARSRLRAQVGVRERCIVWLMARRWFALASRQTGTSVAAGDVCAADDGLTGFAENIGEAVPHLADAQQFEMFFDRYLRDVFSYLWRMTGDEQAANDLSQETFFRAWQHFTTISAYEQPRSWLLRVATNLAINARRDAYAHHATTLLAHTELPAAGDFTTQTADRSVVRQALQSLSSRQRAALLLHELYGLSAPELAQTLGISVAAAKMTLSRGRARFRTSYSQMEAER